MRIKKSLKEIARLIPISLIITPNMFSLPRELSIRHGRLIQQPVREIESLYGEKIEKTNDKVKVAVDDLSFTAYRGEVFGLLGPNGAGKTTTLRMLATLIKPDQGDAIVDGASIVNVPEEVRSKIGFLTSELKLEDFFTPNYLFDFFSDLYHVPADVRKARKAVLRQGQ